jgi:hypothetical protein
MFYLLFNPEDKGDMSLRSICRLSKEYMALYPRRQISSGEEDLGRRDGHPTEVLSRHYMEGISNTTKVVIRLVSKTVGVSPRFEPPLVLIRM